MAGSVPCQPRNPLQADNLGRTAGPTVRTRGSALILNQPLSRLVALNGLGPLQRWAFALAAATASVAGARTQRRVLARGIVSKDIATQGMELIPAEAAEQFVQVVVLTPVKNVVALAPVQRISACTTGQPIVPVLAEKEIIAITAVQRVVSCTTVQFVVTPFAAQNVVSKPAK